MGVLHTTDRRRRRGARRRAAPAVLGLSALSMLVACDAMNTVTRADAPVVLTGAEVPDLLGADPDRVVAFQLVAPFNSPTWVQVPVQVDERTVVDFGVQPTSNTTAGTTGTVYGSVATSGVTALQYADPGTFVGADPDPTVDGDDEIVVMSRDAGGKRQEGTADPDGVVAGSGVQVQVDDPRGEAERGWIYLYESDGSLDPGAGRDEVAYSFALASGEYKATYKRADGPNPETSVVTTPTYQARLTDRWDDADWRITAEGASGVDLLDGVKNEFALGFCGRSNRTFQDAEGAFVANIDGPLRAIRSYIGANSGPLTQRTNVFYRDHQEIRTDLRVHAIPGILDYLDMSAAAVGMGYQSSVAGPVTVDGVQDPVPTTVPTWELYTGAPGSIVTTSRLSSDIPGSGDIDAFADHVYLDQAAPAYTQCWGDAHLYGAAGTAITTGVPNTDPRLGVARTLATTRTVHYGPPSTTPEQAADLAGQVDVPLVATVTPSAP